MAKPIPSLLLLMLAAGCGRKTPQDVFGPLAREFVYTTLSFSPVAATSAGLHQYEGKQLDEMLDDVSSASLDRQRRFYQDFRTRMGQVDRDGLPPEARADYDIIAAQVGLQLLELDEIRD